MADRRRAGLPAILKNKFLVDATSSTAVIFCNRFISFLRGFVVARLLDPSLFGYFSGLSLIFLYNSQGHLGILHGLNRNLSIAKGASDQGSYESLKNNAVTAIGLLSLLISLGIIGFSFLKAGEYDSKIIWGMRVYAFVAVMYHMEYLYHSFLRVDHRFAQINISRMLFTISNLLLVLVLARLFSFYGVLAALALSMILQNGYLLSRVSLRPRFALDFRMIKGLILTGAPISFAYAIDIVLNSLDRLMIVRFLSPEQLGFYGIGMTFSSEFLLRIPETISSVIYPRILERYGRTGNTSDLQSYFLAPSIMIGCIMAVAIGLMFLTIDYAVTLLLPRYTAAIPVTKILVFSVYFVSINQIAVRIIISINRTRSLLVFQTMAILCNMTLNWIAISRGFGINGVAAATGISYFLYSVAVTHFALKMLSSNSFSSLKTQVRLYLPLGYCVLALGVLSRFPHTPGGLPWESLLVAFHVLVFALMVSPMVWFHLRNGEIRSFLKENT